MMLTKEQSEQIVAEYLSNPGLYFSKTDVERAIDAFVFLHYSVPQPLCDVFSAILQEKAPPGILMKAEPYQGRIRILAIKEKAAAQWAARPRDEHD